MRRWLLLAFVMIGVSGCGSPLRGKYANNVYTAPDRSFTVSFGNLPQLRLTDEVSDGAVAVHSYGYARSATVARIPVPGDMWERYLAFSESDRIAYMKHVGDELCIKLDQTRLPATRAVAYDYLSGVRTGAAVVATVAPRSSQNLSYGSADGSGVIAGDLARVSLVWLEDQSIVVVTAHGHVLPKNVNDELYAELTSTAIDLAAEVKLTGEDVTEPR